MSNITPEEKEQLEETARAIGEVAGRFVGKLISSAIIAGFIYAIITLMIGVPVTYLQVLGVIILVDSFKSILTS